MTWNSERAVEIPIFYRIIQQFDPRATLEVGNVLSHYFSIEHDVVDKYERGLGVLNMDIVEFNPNKTYELIISISTLEHVGFDEEPRDLYKVVVALQKLRSWLSYGGSLIVSLPIGYNSFLDAVLREQNLGFTQICCMKRIGHCEWIQTDYSDIKDTKYNRPFPYANGLVICAVNLL
jgi:hypothetical protein